MDIVYVNNVYILSVQDIKGLTTDLSGHEMQVGFPQSLANLLGLNTY